MNIKMLCYINKYTYVSMYIYIYIYNIHLTSNSMNVTQQRVYTVYLYIHTQTYWLLVQFTISCEHSILYILLKTLMLGHCLCTSLRLFHNLTPVMEMRKHFMVEFLIWILKSSSLLKLCPPSRSLNKFWMFQW